MSQRADPRTNRIMSGGQAYQPPTAEEERQRIARIQQGMSQDPMQRIQGMFSRPPTGGGVRELTPRQQRRQEFLARRGRQTQQRGGRVRGQPVGGMPEQELTPRQQRRQQFLQRRDARQQRRVDDYRAQQQAQQVGGQLGQFAGSQPGNFMGGQAAGTQLSQLPEGVDPRTNVITGELGQETPGLRSDMEIVPYENMALIQQLPPGTTFQDYANGFSGLGQGMGQPERQMNYAQVNAMPGQLRTGTFTPQGMYRPLPFYATPEQVRERQALIETGGYFDQPTPAQRRMR